MAATAATCASENLRPLIYTLVEIFLSKCPEQGRLYYILDTLDNCPYDNLKVAVIGTLKKQLSSPEKRGSLFNAPGLLNEIGPRLFRLPEEVLDDEERGLDKAGFIIECLSLYRLLLLKKEDSVCPPPPLAGILWLIVDWSERSGTGDAHEFCVAGTVKEECGKVDQGGRNGGGGMLTYGRKVNGRMRRSC